MENSQCSHGQTCYAKGFQEQHFFCQVQPGAEHSITPLIVQVPEPYHFNKVTLEILLLLSLLLCDGAVEICLLMLEDEPFFFLLLWSLDLKLSEILS